MRPIPGNLGPKLLGSALAIVLATAMLGGAAGANIEPETGGGSADGGIFATATSSGHNGGGRTYPDCNWEHMWKTSIWDSLIGFIEEAIAIVTGNVPPGSEKAELVLDIDAAESNLFLDGQLAELLGRDGSYIVSYEGADVTIAHKVVTQFVGIHRVGQFKSQPASAKSIFHKNPSFPAIQRGTWSGGDLWWDPYYIPADDPGDPECEPGRIYFPRNADPVTLVPDLQEYMHSLLPSVIPELRPLEKDGGWAYVQVPLNFTTAASSLVEVEASASVYRPESGEVWANATAVPVSLIFDPGDGSDEVRCLIADAIEPFDPETPGNCSFTYLDSSNTEPTGVFDAVLGVEWRGEYRSSSNGTLVNFPIESTYIEIELPVGEARASVAVDP